MPIDVDQASTVAQMEGEKRVVFVMEISGKRCHAISFGWLLCFMHLQSFSGAAIPEESRSTLTELNWAPST